MDWRIPNDEPTDEDFLGHTEWVERVARVVRECSPPYVIGVGGAWGAGKTSFLMKLGEALDPKKGRGQVKCRTVWFNPWQHQFEENPLVALLHEIREGLGLTQIMGDDAVKFGKLTGHALMDMLVRLAPIPGLSSESLRKRSREIDAERFATRLSSQRFQELFEKTIEQVLDHQESSTKKKYDRLVILIDDLDRCEGELVYRLLESLKLYLSAKRCVFVIGLDQGHLEEVIARILGQVKPDLESRLRARSYLAKIFQHSFPLPQPASVRDLISRLLLGQKDRHDPEASGSGKTTGKGTADPASGVLPQLFENRFGLPRAIWPQGVIRELDRCLPHNPRKVKAFLSSWMLYLHLLADQHKKPMDWRLTIILNYLAQFEEPFFRMLEEVPSLYNDALVSFCEKGVRRHRLLEGVVLPYGLELLVEDPANDDEAPSLTESDVAPSQGKRTSEEREHENAPTRVLYIAELVREVGAQDVADLSLHLLGSRS